MRSYAKMLEDIEEEELKKMFYLGFIETIWIRGNVTVAIGGGNGYTDLYRENNSTGFRVKTEYWL